MYSFSSYNSMLAYKSLCMPALPGMPHISDSQALHKQCMKHQVKRRARTANHSDMSSVTHCTRCQITLAAERRGPSSLASQLMGIIGHSITVPEVWLLTHWIIKKNKSKSYLRLLWKPLLCNNRNIAEFSTIRFCKHVM